MLACLQAVLRRAEADEAHIGFPGEGGERRFRGWLVSDFLIELLGWPQDRVVSGERFDVLLCDAEGLPVVTIETKAPRHRTSERERAAFRERLSGYPTLRGAYLTNGASWQRLDLPEMRGSALATLQLDEASAVEAAEFFAPLAAERYGASLAAAGRRRVERSSTHVLQALAADLDESVRDLVDFLVPLFRGLRAGQAGLHASVITANLFDQWCEKSLLPSPRRAFERIADLARAVDARAREFERPLVELGLPQDDARAAAEELAGLPLSARESEDALRRALWPAYDQALASLSAQTAHVLLGRVLLYRIGEDKRVFPERLSGDGLGAALAARQELPGTQAPALDLTERVRANMQTLLPAVYLPGEFDWWAVDRTKRAALQAGERAWLAERDSHFERIVERLLRRLDGYSFSGVDSDVWRNVYQEYLPAEERQRLGGFYTPDELVSLVLDLAGYRSETPDLCSRSFLDPACGSGAFVSTALGRLLEHLERDMPCHGEVHAPGTPEWIRAERLVELCTRRLHGIDLHPFAAFLSTLNALFLLLPWYVTARAKNPALALDLHVFSDDALEKPASERIEPDLFAQLNARVQLQQESRRRYQALLGERFDYVFGNPPWGGVLKGRLAPVYDAGKKKRFAQEYPGTAIGKYDVYGLFVERAVQVLKPGGTFALVTPDTFIDKEWASGLRALLGGTTSVGGGNGAATRVRLCYVVDLNPFGQLFFHAMNTPSLVVGEVVTGAPPEGRCLALLVNPLKFGRETSVRDRRCAVERTVREALATGVGDERGAGDAPRVRGVSLRSLRATAALRWDLAARGPVVTSIARACPSAAELLEMRQGVTPGGHLEVFLLEHEAALALALEEPLVHRAVKGKHLDGWRVRWGGQVLLYPYLTGRQRPQPAFRIDLENIADKSLREAARQARLDDALDFERPIDARERKLLREGLDRGCAEQLLKHRVALGLVAFPRAAAYLVRHYERLSGRVFEGKRFGDSGKQWYEYHRPRDARVMLRKERILCPTLVRAVRFCLDTQGHLSDHACWFLQPGPSTRTRFRELCQALEKALGRPVRERDALKYCLAFLNGPHAQEQLTAGHRPTPKGSYQVNKQKLREIPVALPTSPANARALMGLVDTFLRRAPEPAELHDLARLTEVSERS